MPNMIYISCQIFHNIIFVIDIWLCHNHCGCTSRKRRSFELPISENKESNDIQIIEKLNFAIIGVDMDVDINQESHEDNSKQLVEFETLNQFYSCVSERVDEIDNLFEWKFPNSTFIG